MKTPSLSLGAVPALITTVMILTQPSSQGASVISNATGNTGNWADDSSWVQGSSHYVPGSNGVSDNVFIRGDDTITINSNVTPTGNGAVGNIAIGESADGNGFGTLIVATGGSLNTTGTLQVMRSGGSLVGAYGALNMTGGTLNVGSTLSVGLGISPQSGNGSGQLTVSNGSNLSVGGNMTVGSSTAALGSGFLNVVGSNSTISGSGGLTVNAFGTIDLTFGSQGISLLDYDGALTLASGSSLVIDGSGYAGLGGTFTLLDGASLSGTFTNVSITGFHAIYGTPTLSYDSINGSVILTTTAIPEPHTVALMAMGLVALCWRVRKSARVI